MERSGQHDVAAERAHDRLSDLLGDGFGAERGEEELAFDGVAVKERGRDKGRGDERGADLVGVVDGAQLDGEALVEAERGGLGGVVVDHARGLDVGAHARDGHDVAVVGGDHVRDELLRHVPVRERVDAEDKVELARRGGEHVRAAAHAGVVDHHGRGPVRAADALAGPVDRRGRAHVGVDVRHVWGWGVWWWCEWGCVSERERRGWGVGWWYLASGRAGGQAGGEGGHTGIIFQRKYVQHHDDPSSPLLVLLLIPPLFLLPFPLPLLLILILPLYPPPLSLLPQQQQLPTKPQDDLLADTRAAARHDDHLPVPVPRGVRGAPVVLRALRQPRANPAEGREPREVAH